MKFKTEILMLLIAIALFAVSALCYSYSNDTNEIRLTLESTYPYRFFVIPFISTGFVLMGIASFSFSKKNKNILG